MKAKISIPIKLLKAVSYTCSKDQNRYVLQNIQVNFRKERVVLVATNGRILLAAVIDKIEHDLSGKSFLIPSSLCKYLKASDGDITVEVDGDYVILRDIDRDGLSVSRKMCDGSFPNWKQIVPKGELRIHSCTVSQETSEILFSAISVFNKFKDRRYLYGYSVDGDTMAPHICHIEDRMFGLYMPCRYEDRKMEIPTWLFKD